MQRVSAALLLYDAGRVGLKQVTGQKRKEARKVDKRNKVGCTVCTEVHLDPPLIMLTVETAPD